MAERIGRICQKEQDGVDTILRGNVEVCSDKQIEFSFFVNQESRVKIGHYEDSEIVTLSYNSSYDMDPDDADCFDVKIKSIKKNCIKLTRRF